MDRSSEVQRNMLQKQNWKWRNGRVKEKGGEGEEGKEACVKVTYTC
jgi:hypothetical protein